MRSKEQEFIDGVIAVIEAYEKSKPEQSSYYFIEQIVDLVIVYERKTGLLNRGGLNNE